jgi:dipeptidyl aminopeptidase/acylaminoacyl peptidase
LVLLLPVLVVIGCREQVSSVEEPRGKESDDEVVSTPGDIGLAVNRITYVNPYGELFIINPDGTDQLKLTGGSLLGGGREAVLAAQTLRLDSFYAWPTWSPDGTKLAASRVQVSGRQAEVTLEVIYPSTGRVETVFRNATPGMVADGTPHYIYWAPDSRSLAFLASTSDGLALHVVDAITLSEPVVVASGAPLYFHWARSSQSLLAHVGEDILRIEEPFGVAPAPVASADLGFRVAALSPDGTRMVYPGSETDAGFLVSGSAAGAITSAKVLEVGSRSAVAWSPDGERLAVVDQDNPSVPAFDRLRVVREDGSEERTLAEGHVMAFYWSPAGDLLAWVTLDVDEQEFVWWVGNVSGEEAKPLFRFQPSGEVLMMLSFFDQYAYSHSPWSPDGAMLVVAGAREQPMERRNGHTPGGAHIYVIQADGSGNPRELAAGNLAFWSWN